MGNSLMGRDVMSDKDNTPIHTFYSSNAWIEGRAEDQLRQVSKLDTVQQVAAFPDLHPGKYGPVGCAVLADGIYPALIGNDIGCGMALFELDLPASKLKINRAEKQLRKIGDAINADLSEELEADDLPHDLWPLALGTIGGGNHFCELQICKDTLEGGLDQTRAYLLVHSGSRGLGNAIIEAYLNYGNIALNGDEAKAYLAKHNQAVRWAQLNRRIIAERAALNLKTDVRLITDSVHNLVMPIEGRYLHRKGAAVAGGLVPLAGSRSTHSFLIDTSHCPEDALNSCAHGSGRKYDRHSMHGRVRAKKSSIEALRRNSFGGRVICEDKSMLIEEAPLAYKSSETVLSDLESHGVASRIATLQPLITFKKIKSEREA